MVSSISRNPIYLAIMLCLPLIACGGGGGSSSSTTSNSQPSTVCSNCSTGTLTGTAASGAAIASAVVVVYDVDGKTARGVADENGIYKIDVSGLKPPFLIEVTGNVGGQGVVLHSVATADDVGKSAVNVTPLTELIAATAMGAEPSQGGLSKITAASIQSAEAAIEAKLEPVLKAAGITSADLRTTEFTANSHTGLDAVLDALKLTPPAAGGTGYVVSLVSGTSSVTVDPANPGTAKIDAPAAGTMNALAKNAAEIQAMLNDFSTKFSGAIPAADTLKPYFTSDFQYEGNSRDDFIAKVLRNTDSLYDIWKNVSFDALKIERLIDADQAEISFRVLFDANNYVQPGYERLIVKRVGGQWVFAGNSNAARVFVSLSARLKETPLTETELAALPGVLPVQDQWGTYYVKKAKDGTTWLNLSRYDQYHPEKYPAFGILGYVENGTRAQQRELTEYYVKPSSRVTRYILFWIPSNRVSSTAKEIVVTGPGLPSGGLTLVSSPTKSRWIFKGDTYNWNAFNTERCVQVNNSSSPVANCKMDWTTVSRGSEYTFTLKDANGATLGTLKDQLRTNPIDEAEAYKRRADLFPIMSLDDAHAFTVNNVLNDTDGPFMAGKDLTLNWTVPSVPGYRMNGLWFEASGDSHFEKWVPMYNPDPKKALPTSQKLTLTHTGLTSFVYATLGGYDAFGNYWDQELSQYNPR